ncbi:MAG: SGNH/GDSL hydrolase family protein [Bacilli bacterium]|nr:SGNH/GDSL hydrolase family protein [Bacilli bacterium]
MKINFLGDSITEGSLATTYEKTFVYLVGEKGGFLTRNYGIGGTRFAKQRIPSQEAKYDRYFASRIAEMDHDADFVFVFGGTNDYGHGDAPFGEEGDRTPETFYGAIDDLIRQLLQHYRKEQIVFIPPLYRVNEDSPWGDGSREKPCPPLSAYRKAISEVANSFGVRVFDIKDEIGKAENNPLIADGLHPNDKGHEKIADLIVNYIKTVLSK